MGEGRFVQLVAITSNNEQNIALVFTIHCNGIMSPNPACIALCYTLIEPKPYNALNIAKGTTDPRVEFILPK